MIILFNKKVVSIVLIVFAFVQSTIADEVIMAGVGGNNSRQMVSRLKTDVLSHEPTTVVILAGTNDFLNSGNSVSLAEFESNLKSILSQVKAINSKIVLMTIPPCTEKALLARHDSAFYAPEGPNGRVEQGNEVIVKLAEEYAVHLVDMYRIFSNDMSLMSADGVHPNTNGCLVMADSIYQVFQEQDLPTEKVVCFGNSITKRYTEYLEKLVVSAISSPSFEFLFDENSDTQGLTTFNGGALSVSSGNLTFTYGSSTSGFQLNPPASAIQVDKTNFPFLAIKLSATPTLRRYMYCKVGSTGGWYMNKKNPPADEALDAVNVFYYDMSGANFPDAKLPDGDIVRLIFNLETNDGSKSIDVEWIKTFASVEDIKAYAGFTTNSMEIAVKSQPIIVSGHKNIVVKKCDRNTNISLFNMSGVLVYNKTESANEVTIPCYSGVYLLKLSTSNGVYTNKVRVQ